MKDGVLPEDWTCNLLNTSWTVHPTDLRRAQLLPEAAVWSGSALSTIPSAPFGHNYSKVKPHCSIFRIFTAIFRMSKFLGFLLQKKNLPWRLCTDYPRHLCCLLILPSFLWLHPTNDRGLVTLRKSPPNHRTYHPGACIFSPLLRKPEIDILKISCYKSYSFYKVSILCVEYWFVTWLLHREVLKITAQVPKALASFHHLRRCLQTILGNINFHANYQYKSVCQK